MVQDLNFPVKIDMAPICREADGLAMSSRNRYLKGNLRMQAVVLWRSIEKIHALVRDSSRPIPAGRLKTEVRRLVKREPAARLDYVEFFDHNSLAPEAKVKPGTHMALAVFIDKTRLIDNARL